MESWIGSYCVLVFEKSEIFNLFYVKRYVEERSRMYGE